MMDAGYDSDVHIIDTTCECPVCGLVCQVPCLASPPSVYHPPFELLHNPSLDPRTQKRHLRAWQEELLNDHVESHFLQDSIGAEPEPRSDANGTHMRACPYGCGASVDASEMDSHMLAHQ